MTRVNEELVERIRARRMTLKHGKFLNATSPHIAPDNVPDWYEPDTFRRAQQLYSNYKVIIRFNHIIGVNIMFTMSEILDPVLATGSTGTLADMFARYLTTMRHIDNFYEADPFEKKSASYRSIRLTRHMHQKVFERMNRAAGTSENGESIVWLNQHDMAFTLFTFIGPMMLFPKKLGFHHFTEADLYAFCHLWRCIGHCIGIEDRFNPCEGTYEEVHEMFRQLYFDEWLPKQSVPDIVGIQYVESICTAISCANVLLDYNSLMHYAAPFMRLDRAQFPLNSVRRHLIYYIHVFNFKVASRFKVFHWITAKLSNRIMARIHNNQTQHIQNLKEKYSQIKFPNRCPFTINFNYADIVKKQSEAVH